MLAHYDSVESKSQSGSELNQKIISTFSKLDLEKPLNISLVYSYVII